MARGYSKVGVVISLELIERPGLVAGKMQVNILEEACMACA